MNITRLAIIAGVLVCATTFADHAGAQSEDELRRQLEAQMRINEQLRSRIAELEARGAPESQQLPAPQVRPAPDPEKMEDDDRALEQALIQAGRAVLPPGRAQLGPSFGWNHSGSDRSRSSHNSYLASLSGRVGLPGSMMIGANLPYVLHTENAAGKNSGVSDISVSLWKQLLLQGDYQPSLVASMSYSAPTGEDPFESKVALGSGFHGLRGTLSAVKSFDPVAFYGDLSYSHAFGRKVSGFDLQPGDALGIRVGSTLAATPEISLTLGLGLSFLAESKRNNQKIDGSARTIGFLELGSGIILSEHLFLAVSGQFGVTEDAPDMSLRVALPIRF
jgi:hypothetical protein